MYCSRFARASTPHLRALHRTIGAAAKSNLQHVASLTQSTREEVSEAVQLTRAQNGVALQPDSSFMPAEAILVFHDAAGPPDGGAAAFFTDNPDGFRGGGSFFFGPDRKVRLFRVLRFRSFFLKNNIYFKNIRKYAMHAMVRIQASADQIDAGLSLTKYYN
eukprot:SAG31_NODE_10787_length_1097_cov_4.246493_1_plen_161_part_00